MASKKPPVSNSAFILSQPMNWSTAEVIAKAKAAGRKLTSELVHQVRDSAKAAGAAKRAAEKKVAVSATKASASSKTPKRKSLPAKTVTKKVMKQAAAVAETPAPIPIGDADVALASPKPRASASHDEIAKAAYLRWLGRGQPQGTDLEDWSAAERELTAQLSAK